jgi:hypothetical protein
VKSNTETKMRMKWLLTTLIFVGMAALTGAAAQDQAGAPASGQTPTAANQRASSGSRIQTDVALSGLYALNSGTSGLGTKQTAGNGVGGLFELRQIAKPLLGYEFAVFYNQAPQAYEPNPGACGLVCNTPAVSLGGRAVGTSLAYVVSHQFGNLRPFALAGVGVFIAVPDSTPLGNNTSIRGAYVYGGGVDWSTKGHLGVRLQCRANLYKAPNTSSIYPATGMFTQSIEPAGGIFWRF